MIVARSLSPPLSSFLILRGLKTLTLRMERHSTTALYIPRTMEARPAVRLGSYSFPEYQPGQAIARRQIRQLGDARLRPQQFSSAVLMNWGDPDNVPPIVPACSITEPTPPCFASTCGRHTPDGVSDIIGNQESAGLIHRHSHRTTARLALSVQEARHHILSLADRPPASERHEHDVIARCIGGNRIHVVPAGRASDQPDPGGRSPGPSPRETKETPKTRERNSDGEVSCLPLPPDLPKGPRPAEGRLVAKAQLSKSCVQKDGWALQAQRAGAPAR